MRIPLSRADQLLLDELLLKDDAKMRRACAQSSEDSRKGEKKGEEGKSKTRKKCKSSSRRFSRRITSTPMKSARPEQRGHVFRSGPNWRCSRVRSGPLASLRDLERACITAADGSRRDCSCLRRTPAVSFRDAYRNTHARCFLRCLRASSCIFRSSISEETIIVIGDACISARLLAPRGERPRY